MAWTLADIRRKVRQVTGRLSSDSLPLLTLDRRINNFYQFTFPAEVKLDRQHTYYTFNTVPNTKDYAFPVTQYTNIEPPVWLNGVPLSYFQDPKEFYWNQMDAYMTVTIGAGDAVVVVFTTTLTAIPIIPGTMIVTDNTETFIDDGLGILTRDGVAAGAIDYLTGALTVTFAAAPTTGTSVTARFVHYKASTPVAVLYYDTKLTFWPIPDTVYPVKMKAYATVLPLVEATDTPLLEEWGPAIAYGTSRDIHADFSEAERYAEVTELYKQQIDYVLIRTAQNRLNTRAFPSF